MSRVLGIVAEYNPFHLGHSYHLQRARAETGCRYAVIAMSGNFVQRGEPALIDKWVRAKMAIAAGADLVIEIPTLYALQSAEGFAKAAIEILVKCQASTISFGSECGDIAKLSTLADWFQTPEAQDRIRQNLSGGVTYAAAIEKAALESPAAHLSNCLQGANNILAVEYLRALASGSVTAHTIKRQEDFPRAAQIRELINQSQFKQALAAVPACVKKLLANELHHWRPVTIANFTQMIFYALACLGPNGLRRLPACSEGLENRVLRAAAQTTDVYELLALIKTKRYPYTRLQRLLMQALLRFDAAEYSGPVPYLRVLAGAPGHRALLPALARSGIPLLYSIRDFKGLDRKTKTVVRLDEFAQQIFRVGRVRI